ncbi:glycine--tRNA ligase-like [Hyalella azteca]|uniref:Glycine--tRNA ligase-like n=1 Tax=Hyalella azteca TaxID=294128 RepID=A0A8B7NQI8_HYAAZ|nr:glycine--tRNA ligase-like [Hyalella azteca]
MRVVVVGLRVVVVGLRAVVVGLRVVVVGLRELVDIAFEPYGAVAGLYDFGDLGQGLMENLLQEWKRHFVLHDNMLRVACPVFTPEAMLKASGHVDRFADCMVKDVVTGECYRLDHLIKLHLEKKISSKNFPEGEKAAISSLLARLDGLDVVRRRLSPACWPALMAWMLSLIHI